MHPGCMDYISDSSRSAGCYRGTPKADFAYTIAFRLDCPIVRLTNRPGHPATENQIRVGGVNDGFRVLLDNVALDDCDFVPDINKLSSP
jgi:hypothetical protein